MTTQSLLDFLDEYNEKIIRVVEVRLHLHSIFWFHSYAQPREKYTHIVLPIIHNYPLTIALLGRPVESSYASISGLITKTLDPSEIWNRYGFYVYPALPQKAYTRTLLFSMGGTGYISLKPKTRASIPDFTANQVYLPGTEFITYILLNPTRRFIIPDIVRLGAKRYGVFKVETKRIRNGRIEANKGMSVTHPFNVAECPAVGYQGVLHHYAGTIAFNGIPHSIIKVGNVILASPSFLEAE